jgi:hypothetical protein
MEGPDLDRAVRRAEGLIADPSAVAAALADPVAIDLPPGSSSRVDPAHLRATATLYLVAECEAAGILAGAEDLSRLFRAGGVTVDLGDAAPLLQAFWQARNERPSAEERLGFFAGLFGMPAGPVHSDHPRNEEFEDRFIDVCEALYRLGGGATVGIAQQAPLRRTSQRLLDNLQRVMGEMTVFFAQEVLGMLKQALAICGHPAVRAALGARDLWAVVDRIDQRMRRPSANHAAHVRRGQAGMNVLAWLADVAPVIEQPARPLIEPDHPAIAAAIEWMEDSLALAEAGSPAPTVGGGSFVAAPGG